jgi:hypothetical protein
MQRVGTRDSDKAYECTKFRSVGRPEDGYGERFGGSSGELMRHPDSHVMHAESTTLLIPKRRAVVCRSIRNV